MKHLFTTFFLIGMSLTVCSQDYYWYKGTKVPLERGCRKYIIYENDKLSESDKSHITHSEDVFYDEIPNLKWGTTTAHAIIEDTAHVHYSIISYRKDGDYYDNIFVTHRFYVQLKNQENLPLLQELADRYSVEIENKAALVNEQGVFPAWYILRCKLDAPKNALELANLFYETTNLFSATEPEMINIFLPEFPKAIKTLCNEWNVLVESFCWPTHSTIKYRLSSDTIINEQRYLKLCEDNVSYNYYGALREGNNRDIYYIPTGSTHEYLLYAFNAQVGDTITNLHIGGMGKEEGYKAVVRSISDSNPRIFTIGVSLSEENEYPITWIEGVGSPQTPYGLAVVPTIPADIGVFNLLCAYKNGEQVYVSEMGEQYGCDYNYDSSTTHRDTIPLYIQDGPGSSTVEPVDPNLVYATLTNDILSIYSREETENRFTLYKAPTPNQMPASRRAIKATSFTDSISTTITEPGTYTIELTNPAWDYTIVGTFDYRLPQAVENTPDNTPSATKILRNGQLIILYKGQTYNILGQPAQ